jgi:hypothetical protein
LAHENGAFSNPQPYLTQNQFDANDMWLPLGDFLFFLA